MAANAYIVCGRCGAAGHHYTLCRGEVRPDLTLSQVVVECPPQPIIPGETRWPDLDSLKRGLGAWNHNMGLWVNSFSDFLEQVEEMSTYFDASTCTVNPYSEGIKVTFDVPSTRVALAVAERITANTMNEAIPANNRRRQAEGSGAISSSTRAHNTRPTTSLNSSQARVGNDSTTVKGHGNNSMGNNRPVEAPKLVNHPNDGEKQSAVNSSSFGDSDDDISNTRDLGSNSLLNSPFESREGSHARRRQPQAGYRTRNSASAAPSSLDTISMAHIPSSSLPKNATGATTTRRIIPPRRRRPGAGSSLHQLPTGPVIPEQHSPEPSTHKVVRFAEVEPTFPALRQSPHTMELQSISAEGYHGETTEIDENDASDSSTRVTTQLAGKKRTFADVEFNTDVDFEVEQSDGSSEA